MEQCLSIRKTMMAGLISSTLRSHDSDQSGRVELKYVLQVLRTGTCGIDDAMMLQLLEASGACSVRYNDLDMFVFPDEPIVDHTPTVLSQTVTEVHRPRSKEIRHARLSTLPAEVFFPSEEKPRSKDSIARASGVSVEYLAENFMKEVRDAEHDDSATVVDIEPTVIRPKGVATACPHDGRKGAAYVDCVHGEDSVGDANVMLSYVWSYTVQDIVATLSEYCRRHKVRLARTYVWMCCLCVNQHRVKERAANGETVPFAEFEAAFGKRVLGTGTMIAMMTPWDNPNYLKRAWSAVFGHHWTDLKTRK